jgi:fructose-1,6-bisphosphatase/inositol monophosphatase family enzyme
VSIGLCHKKVPILGVIYAPMIDQLFLAIKGKGSFQNGIRMKVSNANTISEALVLTEYGYQRDKTKLKCIGDCLNHVIAHGAHAVRQLGSGVLDLCYVANGSLDVAYAGVAGESWKPWDHCAGMLMV